MKSFVKYWFPLLIWLGVIFVGSTNLMSAQHTSRFIVPFLLWLKPGISPQTIWVILVVMRKCAHVAEYVVLALLLWRALRSVAILRTKTLMVFGALVLGCALFAASDEFHQTFVKSRTPSVRDVLLDIAGAILGLLIGASFARRHPKNSEPPLIASLLMRNCNARMTGEVHKRFYARRCNWSVLPKARSVIAALVACVAMYSETAPTLRAAPQQSACGSNSERVSRAPVITAKPERVTVTGGGGGAGIEWDTGNGSPGFVFVTGDGRKPVLFAKGSRGSRVASWIGRHYVFELYGDNQRRTLLARVTVSGSPEALSSQRKIPWQDLARWVLILALAAVSYFAVYLSSTGPLRTTFPTEPTTSPRPLHVGGNLFLGIAAFICVDAIIFHSGLYVSILAPDSYAGRVAEITRAERERASSGLKEVLVLGDSRIAEGFSTTLANELGSPAGLEFVSLAEPAASANTWYYMVREVDPTTRRYSAIVIPYGVGYEPNSADPLRISMTAPLLRYGDCFHFASGFQRWSGLFRAFTACILRGSAYQDDVVDLLEHPIARLRGLQQEGARMHSRAVYKGRDYDLVGTTYDATTGRVMFASKLTEAQRLAFRKSLIQPSQSDTEYSLKLQREWIPRIMNRYSNSPTAIVLTPVPRGPFVEFPGFYRGCDSILPSSVIQRSSFSLAGHTFDFLEKPEYYFDAFHLNSKGRRRFTETLVSELMERVRSANWKRQHKFESQVALNRACGTETN